MSSMVWEFWTWSASGLAVLCALVVLAVLVTLAMVDFPGGRRKLNIVFIGVIVITSAWNLGFLETARQTGVMKEEMKVTPEEFADWVEDEFEDPKLEVVSVSDPHMAVQLLVEGKELELEVYGESLDWVGARKTSPND